MTTLSLSTEEAATLRSILEGYLGELRMEIANTDSQDFRDKLRKNEVFVKDLLTRLAGQ